MRKKIEYFNMILKKEVINMNKKEINENEKTAESALLYIGAGVGENAGEYL